MNLIKTNNISSQNELAQMLRNYGINVTQATLSRDLKSLKVTKIASDNGEYIYIIPDSNELQDSLLIRGLNSVSPNQQVGFVSIKFSGNIAVIKPGMELTFSDITVHVLRGKHIEFDRRYIPATLSPYRVLRYPPNMPFLFWANRTFQEGGQIVAFEICAEEKQILLLGSLNLLPEENYPHRPDLLILPYQGNNDLVAHADHILDRIRPKNILLSHFDNAFPPESRDVDLRPLKKLLTQKYPHIHCVKPTAGKAITF